MNEPTRLEALYEALAENRAAQEGMWTTGRARTQDAHDSFMDGIKGLEREEDALVEEIESLGGEDPEL